MCYVSNFNGNTKNLIITNYYGKIPIRIIKVIHFLDFKHLFYNLCLGGKTKIL